MKTQAAVLVVALFLSSAADATKQVLEPTSIKVYKGGNGEQVTLVRLADTKPPGVLVKVTGTDTPLDGKIFYAEISLAGSGEDFATYDLGKGRYVLVTQRNGTFELYPHQPGGKSVPLTFDEKATETAKADTIVADYVRLQSTQ